jgi:uncharacterized protein (TIGR03437 family)
MTMQSGESSFGPYTLRVVSTAPGLFTADASGSGQAAALNEDGSLNSNSDPAARGSIVTFFLTGAGAMTPAVADGETIPLQGPWPTANSAIELAFTGYGAAEILYAGAAPGLVAGVIQVKARVPAIAGTSRVSLPVVVRVGASVTQSGVTIAVK